MSPGANTWARLAFSPSVKTGGCSRNQISSGVVASRSSVKRCMARQVGSYAMSPRSRDGGGGAGRVHSGELPVVEAGVVAIQSLLRAVARAHQRSRHALKKAQRQRRL